MPAFRYEALDASGRSTTGLIDADTARAARAQLRAQHLVPMQLQPVQQPAGAGGGEWSWNRRVFSSTALAIWTRQLAGLVAAGLPLERALTALVDESEDPRQRDLVAQLRSEVKGGASFAAALGGAPREFDEVYRAVVSAGEQSGQLGGVLENLADDLEERQALRNKLIGAALYPAIVSGVAVIITTFLIMYVVPQVAQVFAGTKHTLPWLTRFMLGLSALMRQWGWLLLGAVVAGVAGLVHARRNDALRLRMDAVWLTLPLVGRLARSYNAARFAATLSMLADAGVPILKALQAAAETLGNRSLRADAMQVLVRVREGAPLASALATTKSFPGLLSMFARLGEQTGQLPAMLQRAANQMSNEVQRRAMQTATLLEPLLIVVMGLVVLLIVLSIMLPIIQMNTWVK